MVILNLKLDNILCFTDFEINFSYPIKLRTSLIKSEYLSQISSFRYKKLNVLLGSNASGKTSLVKSIWGTLLFLSRKEKRVLADLVNIKDNLAFIEIDLVIPNLPIPELHRFSIKIVPNEPDSFDPSVIVCHKIINLSSSHTSNDSYENRAIKFNEMNDEYLDYLDALKDINFIRGWNIVLPATEKDFDKVSFIKIKDNIKKQNDYLEILNSVFKTLDPSISKISKSNDSDDAYFIERISGERIILQDGMQISSIKYLSSGTKYGVNISNMIFSIKNHHNGIYLFDEQFSYLDSDIEAAILSTMVSLLGDDEQLFFTTHNNDILDLGYPFHSFYFLKKEVIDNTQRVTVSCGSQAENRNNVSAKSLIVNDVFATSPDVSAIMSLGD